MRQYLNWLSAPAGAVVCAAAMGGTNVTQLDEFNTGFNSSGVPLVVPAIDPAGVAWHAPTGHLFIVDSEIEEVNSAWSLIHKNIFEVSPSGNTLYHSYDLTLMDIEEPTGITFNTGDGYFYVSDDDEQRITRLSWTPSGFLVDDYVDTDNTAGAGDPEGVTCDPATGRLYVVDGHDELIVVYRYQDSTGFVLVDVLVLDDLNSSSHVPDDPEGIVFDACSGHLFLVSASDEAIYEFTTVGIYVARYDISDLSPEVIAPQGLTIGPTSATSDSPQALAIYIADGGIDNGDNSSERDGHIYEIAAMCSGGGGEPPPIVDCNGNGVADATDIASGTSNDCNGNGIPDECDGGCLPGATLLMSFISSVTLPGVGSVANEDIVSRNMVTGVWSLHFDGSDVGAGSFTIDALAVLPGGDLLLSFTSDGILAGILADDSDLLRFHPTSLGANTAGTWSVYFDGSDVELTSSSEDIDGVSIAPDGRLVISTTDSPSVTGLSSLKDEDLIAFTATSLGDVTAGTWSMYFDGSDVGLSDSGDEDIDGVSIRPDGKILLSTTGSFLVPGVSGADEDVFVFTPVTLGPVTAGSYASFFIGLPSGVPTAADVGAVERLP